MLSRNTRLLMVGLMVLLFAAPALGMPGGPPWKNGDSLVVETGCTCHGDGVPSTEVVVSISGVPRSYTLDETYTFTVSLQHASNAEGGFMIWDYNKGTLTPGEGSAVVADEPGAIAQSDVGNDWVFTWTAPSEDIGVVPFQLVGNAVNGNGQFDAGDAWNILSFSISAPDTTTNDAEEELAVRTISVGDYDSLFVADVDPEVAEAERQEKIADTFFEEGNIYYFATFSILLVAAVVQGEFYQRKFAGGPEHLDKSLAIPQGIRRGALSAGLLLLFAYVMDNDSGWQVRLAVGMCTLWAMYGVYRTIAQARAEPQAKDLV